MKEHQKESALYLCDPSKNVTCQKSICQSQCVLTTKVEYANHYGEQQKGYCAGYRKV